MRGLCGRLALPLLSGVFAVVMDSSDHLPWALFFTSLGLQLSLILLFLLDLLPFCFTNPSIVEVMLSSVIESVT